MADYLKDLRKSNDAYHEAIEAIITNTAMDTAAKARLGSMAHSIFTSMIELDNLVSEYYEE